MVSSVQVARKCINGKEKSKKKDLPTRSLLQKFFRSIQIVRKSLDFTYFILTLLLVLFLQFHEVVIKFVCCFIQIVACDVVAELMMDMLRGLCDEEDQRLKES